MTAWEPDFSEAQVTHRVTVPPKALKGALEGKPGKAEVRFLPVSERDVDLEVNGTARTVTRIIGMSAEDFEQVPEADHSHFCRLTSDDLDAIAQTAKACSGDETRPTLNGVSFRFGGSANHPEVCATDTSRMATARLDCQAEGARAEASYIIAEKALSVLGHAARGSSATVDCYLAPDVIQFRGMHWRLRTRCIEGEYWPRTNRVQSSGPLMRWPRIVPYCWPVM